jgi:hypothetical protein
MSDFQFERSTVAQSIEVKLSDLQGLTGAQAADDEFKGWTWLWRTLSTLTGHDFPADYRHYVEQVGPGQFAMLEIIHPRWGSGAVHHDPKMSAYDLLCDYHLTVATHHVALNDNLATFDSSFPYTFGAQKGQLCIWGRVNSDIYLCWEITGDSPDRWRIVVCDSTLDDNFTVFEGDMFDLLIAMARGSDPVPELSCLDEAGPFVHDPYRQPRHGLG